MVVWGAMQLVHQPPARLFKDDATGEPLERRSDDSAEVFRKKVQGHDAAANPVLQHYFDRGTLRTINGEQSVGDVRQALLQCLTSARDTGS